MISACGPALPPTGCRRSGNLIEGWVRFALTGLLGHQSSGFSPRKIGGVLRLDGR